MATIHVLQSLSTGQLIGLAVILAAFLYPFSEVLKRAGFSRWYCVLLIVPIVNWVALYVFAFRNWPNLPRKSN
jgi:hypothetical protein